MKIDFSNLNLQNLIQMRDLALQVPERVPQLCGVPERMAELLCRVTPEDLVHIVRISSPLFVPRAAPWWWQRFLQALRSGRREEVEAVLAQAALVVTRP